MNNKEVALKLTIAALENGVIEIPVDTPPEIKPEIIMDFYQNILENLAISNEE